jgi:hypothetical protein
VQPAEAFHFAIDRRIRRWSRLFGVHPETCMVRISATELVVAFGRWSLHTPAANIDRVMFTGPYRWWRVAGPARLSVRDRGITFATSADRGVCLTFRHPVTAFDPFGLIRHGGATVTVADPERFVADVRAAIERQALERELPALPALAPRQGTYRAAAGALWRWGRRQDSVHHTRRDVTTVLPPAQPENTHDDIQRFADGVGPAFHRRYAIVVAHPTHDACVTMAMLQHDLNRVANQRLSPITKTHGTLGVMRPGDRYVVALAGPWSGPVMVTAVEPLRMQLVTLRGHLEAGLIEFRARDTESGGMEFIIESWARSGDQALRAVYDLLRVAQALQSEMWVQLCESVCAESGGRQLGPVQVLTERADCAL